MSVLLCDSRFLICESMCTASCTSIEGCGATPRQPSSQWAPTSKVVSTSSPVRGLSRYCERFRDRDGFPGPSGATSRRRRPSRGHAVRRRSSARSSRRVGGRDPLDRAIRPYRRTLFLRIPSVMGRRREQASFGVVEAARRTSDRGCPSGKRAQSAGIGRECENLPACGTVWMGSEVVCGKSKARARALRPACSQSVMTRRLVGA